MTLPLKLSGNEQNAILFFFLGKILNTTQIYFEMQPVYGGKCFTTQTVYFWCKKWLVGRKLHKMWKCNQSFVSACDSHSSRKRFFRFFWKFKKRDFLRFFKWPVKKQKNVIISIQHNLTWMCTIFHIRYTYYLIQLRYAGLQFLTSIRTFQSIVTA